MGPDTVLQAKEIMMILPLAPAKTCHRFTGESSNGRTADSDSVNLGSNPSSPAIQIIKPLFRGFIICIVVGSIFEPRSTNLPGANLNARSAAPKGWSPWMGGIILVPQPYIKKAPE